MHFLKKFRWLDDIINLIFFDIRSNLIKFSGWNLLKLIRRIDWHFLRFCRFFLRLLWNIIFFFFAIQLLLIIELSYRFIALITIWKLVVSLYWFSITWFFRLFLTDFQINLWLFWLRFIIFLRLRFVIVLCKRIFIIIFAFSILIWIIIFLW